MQEQARNQGVTNINHDMNMEMPVGIFIMLMCKRLIPVIAGMPLHKEGANVP